VAERFIDIAAAIAGDDRVNIGFTVVVVIGSGQLRKSRGRTETRPPEGRIYWSAAAAAI